VRSLRGVGTGEVFGTPVIVGLQLLPTGIASAEAFGTPNFPPVLTMAGIASAEAFGAMVIRHFHPEELYMELPIVALVKSTTSATPGEVIGAREVDVAILPIGVKHYFLVATLQSAVPGAVSRVELWDVTHGVMVTNSQISNTAEGDRTLFGTIISAELPSGVAAGDIRTDAAAEYELRLYRTSGTPGDIVSCSNAHLRIVWD